MGYLAFPGIAFIVTFDTFTVLFLSQVPFLCSPPGPAQVVVEPGSFLQTLSLRPCHSGHLFEGTDLGKMPVWPQSWVTAQTGH